MLALPSASYPFSVLNVFAFASSYQPWLCDLQVSMPLLLWSTELTLFLGNEKIQSSTEGLYNTSFSSQLHTTPVKGVTMHNISYPNMPYTMSVAASEKVLFYGLFSFFFFIVLLSKFCVLTPMLKNVAMVGSRNNTFAAASSRGL